MGRQARGVFVNPTLEDAELVEIVVRGGVGFVGYWTIEDELWIAAGGIEIGCRRLLLSADANCVAGRAAGGDQAAGYAESDETGRFDQLAALTEKFFRCKLALGKLPGFSSIDRHAAMVLTMPPVCKGGFNEIRKLTS